jgi:hypothetical protein
MKKLIIVIALGLLTLGIAAYAQGPGLRPRLESRAGNDGAGIWTWIRTGPGNGAGHDVGGTNVLDGDLPSTLHLNEASQPIKPRISPTNTPTNI